MEQQSRRSFAKKLGAIAALSVPFFSAVGSKIAQAAPKPLVDPAKDALAKALAYVHDAKKADKTKKKDKQGVKADDQNCKNCVFKQGKPEKIKDPKTGKEIEVIGCSMFPGKSVAVPGWCAQWTKGAS